MQEILKLATLAEKLYSVVQTAEGNKGRCNEIKERVQRILLRIGKTLGDRRRAIFRSESDFFGELQSMLESAIGLCSTYAGKNWLTRAWQASTGESKSEGIVSRLNAALADVQFGVGPDVKAGQARWGMRVSTTT